MNARVMILVGSASDAETMRGVSAQLEALGVSWEEHVAPATARRSEFASWLPPPKPGVRRCS